MNDSPRTNAAKSTSGSAWAATNDVFRSLHNRSERAGGDHGGDRVAYTATETSVSRHVCRDRNSAGLGKKDACGDLKRSRTTLEIVKQVLTFVQPTVTSKRRKP